MAKKTFKDNPALQFISAAGPEDQVPVQATVQAHTQEAPPAGYRVDPRYVEKRSRRLQLVLQPSLYERVKAGATAAGLSVNEYIHRALEAVTGKG